ncbi:hypothetical protein DAPPUDRAFT_237877 [Daphnia pulex]|uniref:Uncharacterized protein n=1 Tax=Daphnia pulex TaxID=6669 RepID=E9G4M8_DAPPU|nr:hypothetical protein DAPPUDRAFT_237877 [Daphnia pulex]|eukprot:EFX85529.1 hypothetical protein DAPPUDRAFT_237877 [Daphnia pulex]
MSRTSPSSAQQALTELKCFCNHLIRILVSSASSFTSLSQPLGMPVLLLLDLHQQQSQHHRLGFVMK